jgi:hypothetical protein
MIEELLSLIARAFGYAIFNLARLAAGEGVPVTRRKVLSVVSFVVVVNNRMQDFVEPA